MPHGRTIRADGVEDRANVVHARLKRTEVTRPIREPDAAFIEQNQPRKRRQLTKETCRKRVLPEPNQIAELRHKDEIDRAVAEHLIRDRNIATPRVRDRRDLHRRSLTPRQA